jgi:hypothetical protein
LAESVDKHISYTEYIAESLDKTLYSGISQEVLIKTFLPRNLADVDNSIAYSEYLAESVEGNIAYSEYIAEHLDDNIGYSRKP